MLSVLLFLFMSDKIIKHSCKFIKVLSFEYEINVCGQNINLYVIIKLCF